MRGGGRTETRAGIETEAADFYVEFRGTLRNPCGASGTMNGQDWALHLNIYAVGTPTNLWKRRAS